MPFLRDHGTCCLVVPLKLGVGIITMLAFAHSIVCTLALLTSDIRFQPNGYNLSFFRVPSVVGCFGLLLGFVGLLGVYDDKPVLLKVFNYWFFVKIVAMIVVVVADYWMLYKCDSWLNTAEHLTAGNVQMDKLAEAHVCPWARWAYLIGSVIDVTVWAYLASRCFAYQWQLELDPPYPIDFGRERHDKEGRWRFYQVKDPRSSLPERQGRGLEAEQPAVPSYGSLAEQLAGPPPQELEAAYSYGPDGQRVPRRPAAGAAAQQSYQPDGGRRAEGPLAFAPAPGSPEEMVSL
mmetsp:Transcript_95975/g.309878  ORF Transcript_95975/g.309878 Transcript_95975/m.309878 type:complete len:291 (-) Transcript_95975:80-952(-)